MVIAAAVAVTRLRPYIMRSTVGVCRLMGLNPSNLHLSTDSSQLIGAPSTLLPPQWMVEYGDAWSESSYLEPLEDEDLDRATRHALDLMYELHHYGTSQSHNRITTQRVNHLLQQMLNQNADGLAAEGMAARADALLQRMMIFHSTKRLPISLPRPSRRTFNHVLHLYSRTPSKTREVPDRAMAIVDHMLDRYHTHGDVDMKPHAFHFNCVVLCWKECEDEDRPVEAAKVLLQHPHVDIDSSLLVNTLRTCSIPSATQKGKLLGASVALKICQDYILAPGKELPEIPSHAFAHIFQAIRVLPTNVPMRGRYFDLVFAKACSLGKVNRFVVSEFTKNARDASLVHKYFAGKNSERDWPHEWTKNAEPILQPDK